jgi:hypothetical protein
MHNKMKNESSNKTLLEERKCEGPINRDDNNFPEHNRNTANESNLQHGWFSKIPLWVLCAAVVLYWFGWGYLYGYYSPFGLSLNELGLDPPQMMAYGSRVLQHWSIFSLSVLLSLVIVSCYWAWISRKKLMRTVTYITEFGVGLILTIGFMLFASFSAVRAGRDDASRDIRETTTTLPMVNIVANVADNALAAEVLPDARKLGYRLLLHGKQGYYLFLPLKNLKGIPIGNLSVLYFPYEKIAGFEINAQAPEEIK